MTTQQPNNIADLAKRALGKSTKPGTMYGLSMVDTAATLEPYAMSIAAALPNGSPGPSRIIQAAAFQISNNPALAGCTTRSIIGCVLNASLLGINPTLKQCFFIPYRNGASGQEEAQFQLSYTGLIALARRSGQVKDVYAEVVRKGDKFEVTYGTDRKIVHQPDLTGGSERELLYAYAVVQYQSGGFEFVVMDKSEIEKRRLKSRGQKPQASGVWLDWTAEMWKKTALRSLLKTAPLSDEQAAAIATDGVTVVPENFKRGEVRVETLTYEDGSKEADDLASIRDGLADCHDLDDLERYWQQGAQEWAQRTDVIELFKARKKELSDG